MSWFHGGVLAFTGAWGSCKTIALAQLGLQAMKDGYEVYSNFGLEGSIHYSDLHELIEVVKEEGRKPRLLLIDEIGMILPADEPGLFSEQMRFLWYQGRKAGFSVAYSVQDFSYVTKKVRMITSVVIRCRGGFYNARVTPKGVKPKEYRPRIMARMHYYPIAGELRESSRPFKREFQFFDKFAASKYDTFFMIDQAKQQLLGVQKVYESNRVFSVGGNGEAVAS